MTLSSQISVSLKKFIYALVLLAFLTIPIAEARHVDVEPNLACERVTEIDRVGEKLPEQSHHDHHAHSCGSCHVHMFRLDTIPHFWNSKIEQLLFSFFDEKVISSPLGGVYRPPRS